MADFRLDFSGERLTGDLVRDGSRFAEDGGLETAVLMSLFLDRRANPDDELPDGETDPRGYWADLFSSDLETGLDATLISDRIGSRLWLLRRSVLNDETVTRAREYAIEALEWFKSDGVASAVRVETEAQDLEVLAIGVEIDDQKGGTRRFDFAWDRIRGVVTDAA